MNATDTAVEDRASEHQGTESSSSQRVGKAAQVDGPAKKCSGESDRDTGLPPAVLSEVELRARTIRYEKQKRLESGLREW